MSAKRRKPQRRDLEDSLLEYVQQFGEDDCSLSALLPVCADAGLFVVHAYGDGTGWVMFFELGHWASASVTENVEWIQARMTDQILMCSDAQLVAYHEYFDAYVNLE